MASFAQNSVRSGALLIESRNTSHIPQLYKKQHLRNLVTNYQLPKPTFSALALGAQKNYIKQLICKEEKWKARCSDDGSCGIVPQFLPPPSVVDAVLEFYDALNAKDIQKLERLLSPDCVYQDLAFYVPCEGRESTLKFLWGVMDAMGPTIQIHVEAITEGDHLTATVFWHLEWKRKKIPFTSGCRFFTFEVVQGLLYIRKILGVDELPLKPGELGLKLLKAASSLFDRYPLATEALLKSYRAHGESDSHFDWFGPLGH